MNEENQTNTTVNGNPNKKGVKAKYIIIAVLAVILIAAIVIGILLATGVIEFNVSKKSKMVAGVEKLSESIAEPLESFKNSEDSAVKILNNLSKDSGIAISEEISANVDNLEIKGQSSSEKKQMNSILELINNSKIGFDVRYDGNEKAYAALNAKIDDIDLSGEVVYDGDQGGIRSETINSKWLKLSKEDIEKILEEQDLDIDEIKESVSEIMETFAEVAKTVEVDEKTQKEFKERYEKILKDFVNEKSKEIKSEKDKVSVNGKSKSCERLTLTLEEKDIKELLNKYIETLKNDKDFKDILDKVVNTYANVAEEALTTMDSKDLLEMLNSTLDNAKEEIEKLEFNGKLVITVYASNTDVYKTDISIEIEETTVTVESTFNDEETVIEISAKSSGVSLDIAKVTIKANDNNSSIKIETASGLEDVLRQKMFIEISNKNEKANNEMKITIDAGNYGDGNITFNMNNNKNEEKEYEANAKIDIDIDIPSIFTAKGNIDLKLNMKVNDISIPSISSSNSIDANNQEQVSEYMKDSEEKINKLIEKASENEILKSLIEDFSNGMLQEIGTKNNTDNDIENS